MVAGHPRPRDRDANGNPVHLAQTRVDRRPAGYHNRRRWTNTDTLSESSADKEPDRHAREALRSSHQDNDISSGLSSGAYGGSRQAVSQSRAAISSAIAPLTWAFKLSKTTTSGPPSCWCA